MASGSILLLVSCLSGSEVRLSYHVRGEIYFGDVKERQHEQLLRFRLDGFVGRDKSQTTY